MLDLYVNIRKRRKELGMSQEELAKKVGYTSRSTIARIENGEIDLSRNKILSFADALKTTPSELMGWSDDYDMDWTHIDQDFQFQIRHYYDMIMKLSSDKELVDMVEQAIRDDDYRNRLVQIAHLLENR